MRVVARRDGDTETYRIPQAERDVPWVESTWTGEWPGEPVDLEWDLPKGPQFQLEPSPNGRAVVRYRRFPLPLPVPGFVVAPELCRRYEGVVSNDNAYAPGGGMIGPKRKLMLHEVALLPPARSSLIVFAHPRDVEALDGLPGDAVSAPKRTARLGGRPGAEW